MTNSKNNSGGFALLCSKEGVTEQVIRDDLGIGDMAPEGRLFIDLMDSGSRIKSMNFLFDIKTKEVAYDHQLNVWVGDVLRTLSFVGVTLKNKILIIAANDQEEAMEFTRDLQHIHNEQANTIRKLMKEKMARENEGNRDQDFSYDDMSALNNELINLQRELARKNAELKRVNDLKNQFLGMAAHDLRNPLAIIHTQSQLLIERASGNLPPHYQKFLNNIYSTAQFMLHLVEDLLDVSKIESGRLNLNLQTFNLVELARNNQALNQVLADRRNIQLHMEYSVDPIYIEGDWHKLEQVFNNLIGNAIKFAPSDSEIRVLLETSNNYAHVSVEDEGAGISPDRQEDIFQPFQKSAESSATEEKGTGLGLNIAKRIVEGHQGGIWVDSKEGKGTAFRFTLPLAKDVESEKEMDQENNEPLAYNLKNKTVLFVEDDVSSRRLMEEMLSPSFENIISCANGNETLEALQKHSGIDLVLLDIDLPDIDGREIARKIKSFDPHVPIIAQTALVKP
ncbi:MAG: ATP-binding protein, partial [Bacteroidota bacterium]